MPTEVTTGAKEIYSPFYISPKTRISDGRRRKAGLMNIQEQRSAESDSALVGAMREREREGREKNRMVSEGGSWKKRDAWRRRDRGWMRKNALTLTRLICWELYILIFISETLSLTSFLFFPPSPAFLASFLSLFFRSPHFFVPSNPAFFPWSPPASSRLFTLAES